jgi:photosystem II stability/assembly factor-like uncharacterized protein
MKAIKILSIILLISFSSIMVNAQWTSVLDDVIPVQIALSPDYSMDQTIYVVDDEQRLLISETGGTNWLTLYEADDPQNPAQLILHIVLSPNFRHDDAIAMTMKDGTMKLSINRGQTWLTALAPEGITDVAFSPDFDNDLVLCCITGAMGPVNFYKSENAGITWGDPVAEIIVGSGFYSKLWNSADMAAKDTFAIQYDNSDLYMSYDGGKTWLNSFEAQVSVRDFVFSPKFSKDSTAFVADAADIYKNTNLGDELSWVHKANFPDAFGIRFAISPDFYTDHTIFAAVDHTGVVRSTDGGETWTSFNDGITSIYPISIAISNAYPYTLFAGTMGLDGIPDKVWKYQSYTGVGEQNLLPSLELSVFPNPVSDQAQVSFSLNKAANVDLSLYDMAGKKVADIYNGVLEKGSYDFRFCNPDHILQPGMYFCRLQTGSLEANVKLLVIR